MDEHAYRGLKEVWSQERESLQRALQDAEQQVAFYRKRELLFRDRESALLVEVKKLGKQQAPARQHAEGRDSKGASSGTLRALQSQLERMEARAVMAERALKAKEALHAAEASELRHRVGLLEGRLMLIGKMQNTILSTTLATNPPTPPSRALQARGARQARPRSSSRPRDPSAAGPTQRSAGKPIAPAGIRAAFPAKLQPEEEGRSAAAAPGSSGEEAPARRSPSSAAGGTPTGRRKQPSPPPYTPSAANLASALMEHSAASLQASYPTPPLGKVDLHKRVHELMLAAVSSAVASTALSEGIVPAQQPLLRTPASARERALGSGGGGGGGSGSGSDRTPFGSDAGEWGGLKAKLMSAEEASRLVFTATPNTPSVLGGSFRVHAGATLFHRGSGAEEIKTYGM